MPRKIQDFAQQSLVKPVLVNVGRAGAANLDVLQVVEYVKQEAKMGTSVLAQEDCDRDTVNLKDRKAAFESVAGFSEPRKVEFSKRSACSLFAALPNLSGQ